MSYYIAHFVYRALPQLQIYQNTIDRIWIGNKMTREFF